MTFNQLSPISLPYAQPVTALSFDPVSDTLWTGSHSGNIVAYYGADGVRGVSFCAGDYAVQKIACGENFIRTLCVSGNGVGQWNKGGANKWFYNASTSLTTFASPVSSSHSIAAASVAPELLLLNAITGTVVRQTSAPAVITHLEFSHSLLLSAAADGYIRTHDPRSGLTRTGGESSVKAHASGITSLQTTGSFVFTIGLSMRQGRPFPDPLVKIYDLRNMRALPPVPFPSGPAYISIIPRRSSSLAIASNQGLVNIVDVSNPNQPSEFYQLNPTSYLTAFAISPTGAYLAGGDAEGIIQLSCRVDEKEFLPFNGFEGHPPVWADSHAPLPDIHWSDSTPLSVIGMPHYKSRLLSSGTSQFASTPVHYPPPQKIPPQVLNALKFNDSVGYAPLPKELKGKRNMVTMAPVKRKGRFRSGKTWENDSEPDTPVSDNTTEEVPKMYRQVEIEYSKFGVEDFDFAFYNKTPYSGLETHILNCYTNSLVQTDCPREHCLLCELGFVFRMLEDADGKNLQASNFCKTVGVLAHAYNSIDLIDFGQNDMEDLPVIQSFHRFLLDHLSAESSSPPDNPIILKRPETAIDPATPPITQLMGIKTSNNATCLYCKTSRDKDSISHIIELAYPRKVSPNEVDVPHDFVSILRASLLRNTTFKSACPSCKRYSTFATRRLIPTKDLPPILAVNANVTNEETMKFWLDGKNSTFLQPRIELRGQTDDMDDPQTAVYELRAIVLSIVEKEDLSHLVAIIKVPDAEGNGQASPWYLFNDFSVRNISEKEALSFPGIWKVPAVLHFERIDTRQYLDFSELPVEDDYSILTRDTSISVNRDPRLVKHECLTSEERPTPGMMVAIDAEFVSMQQEESEYRSDGSHKVIRPARLSLARVSVLRGTGTKRGIPFIDDHIHTSDTIVDYLTEFSGIRYGDLDPARSPYTLTPLKVVYKKLRLLVDSGCIFIGHGLSKDFRIINIFVPPEQVIDTVDVYFRPDRQRRLSLRFLAWFILQEVIQTDTHDSIEDARTALDLYHAHLDMVSQNMFDQKLDELYKAGKQYNFKPPPLPGASSQDSVGRSTPTSQYGGATPPIPPAQPADTIAPTESRLARLFLSNRSSSPSLGDDTSYFSSSRPIQ